MLGIEKTACIVDRCAVYEHLHLSEATVASKNLEKSIFRLYTAILSFLAQAIQRTKGAHYHRTRLGCAAADSFSDNHIQSVFTTGQISDYFKAVEELERTVGYDADTAETLCIIRLAVL